MPKKKNKVLEQFRLPEDVSVWLEKTADSAGKTKTRLVEEALRVKMGLKSKSA